MALTETAPAKKGSLPTHAKRTLTRNNAQWPAQCFRRWLPLLLVWSLATIADRAWLAADQTIPAWDQADYLNSAVDHGRALGFLPGGERSGWRELLLLSPKIPPLASLVHGAVMAVAGEQPDQASWALALWHGLLLLVLDCWARQLHSARLALVALLLAAIAPALIVLRINFTLDLALTASTTTALWQLWCWQRPAPDGGRWGQAFLVAGSLAAALLVKQSALLVLFLPSLWAVITGLRQGHRRRQILMGLAVVMALVLPWLHQNWITTIGGTRRAVIDSAIAEGDPPVFSLASLAWYPRLWWQQLGGLPCLGAMAGLVLSLHDQPRSWQRPCIPKGWGWVLGCSVGSWLLVTLSPNKDDRYIAPVLPLLILWLSLGWLALFSALQRWLGQWRAGGTLVGILVLATGHSAAGRMVAIQRAAAHEPALIQLVSFLRKRMGTTPVTILMVPDSADLNEHTGTYYGRLNRGELLFRNLGSSPAHHPLVLNQAEWLVLATGEGQRRETSRQLSHHIRQDGRFQKLRQWPWSQGRTVELWQRRPDAARDQPFAQQFVSLAQGLGDGPKGLAQFMQQIGPQHQLDGHFLYQQEVEAWANHRLVLQPQATDALWSMAALAILRQDVKTADHWLAELEAVLPENPWPTTYRAVVLLIDWKPWPARKVADAYPRPQEEPEPLLMAVGDLSAVVGGDLTRLKALKTTWPKAIQQINDAL